jgi:DNA-binding MarR family transcriptional regulator
MPDTVERRDRRLEQLTVDQIAAAFRETNLTFDLLGQTVTDRVALGRTDLRVLELLATEGELSPNELAARLRITSGSVTALVDRLVSARCVRRLPHDADGRRKRVVITPAGRRRWAHAWDSLRSCLEQAVERRSEAELAIVVGFLDDARAACEALISRTMPPSPVAGDARE